VVIVVGGGITGLVATYELARAGVQVTLCERSGRLGGKIRTTRLDGFLIESGPDSFIRQRPAAVELARDLGLEHALIEPSEPRVVHVLVGGKLHPLPEGMGLGLPTRLGPLLSTPLFGARDKLRMGLDLVRPRGPLDGDVAVGALLRRRLGNALVERLAGPLLGGVYGTPIDELSTLAVVPHLRQAERDQRSLLLAAVAAERSRPGGRRSGSPFVSLENGVGQLVDALVGCIGRADTVGVRTACEVTSVERRGAGAVVTLAGGERIAADAVVLATSAPVAAHLLETAAPTSARHVRSIPHGSTAVVSLGYRGDQLAGEHLTHGFLVAQGEAAAIDACTVSSCKWSGRAPDGTLLLRAFAGARRPELLGANDADLVRVVHHDVASALGIVGNPIVAHVARWEGCMPQYTVGHLDRVAAALSSLEDSPFVLAGAAFRGAGLPDCISQGRGAGDRVLGILGVEPVQRSATWSWLVSAAVTVVPQSSIRVDTDAPPRCRRIGVEV